MKVIATNVDDPSIQVTYTIEVDILDTAAVFGMGLIIAGVVVLRVFSETGVD